MYLSDSKHIIEAISSTQLFQALNKLDQFMNTDPNQMQLSFNKSTRPLFDVIHNSQNHPHDNSKNDNKINFDMYMAMKNKQKTNQNKLKAKFDKQNKIIDKFKNKQSKLTNKSQLNVHDSYKTNNNKRLQNKQKHYTSVYQCNDQGQKKTKDRSYSPINLNRSKQKSQKKSTCLRTKKHECSDSTTNIKGTSFRQTKISQNSKKIMIERQKKGDTYIPIQYRTNQLLLNKKQKIEKIQQQHHASEQEKKQKQCTFKPAINSYRRPKKEMESKKKQQNIQSLYNSLENVIDTVKIIDQLRQFHSVNNNQLNQNNVKNQNTKQQKNIESHTIKKKQRPVNPKYNTLLDFI